MPQARTQNGKIGPPRTLSGRSLKGAILVALVGLGYAWGLGTYKKSLVQDLATRSAEALVQNHSSVLSLFQASFYFFYEDQFLPGIQKTLAQVPHLKRIQVLSSGGALLFDSAEAQRSAVGGNGPALKPFDRKDVVLGLAQEGPSVFLGGFEAQILMPAGQYGILYTFEENAIRNRLGVALACGLLLAVLLAWVFSNFRRLKSRPTAQSASESRIWGLRSKFLITIVVINLVTCAIVFVTLSALQTREETNRIRKESVLFSQFSTAQVVSDFSGFFYFYYADKFLPAVKTIISTNENLVGLRIISRRTGAVLFDSETALSSPQQTVPISDTPKAEIAPELLADLKARDIATREVMRGGERFLSVINTYRNENREALFLVEYLFTFQSLTRSIAELRRQILIDLVPSVALGLLVAAIFAQLLITPIRRLVAALQRVTAGDYEVSVANVGSDEIGELVTAFNSMTGELRKKTELRKYLSDSTYRQVMESPDASGGIRLGGSRVQATVLFSDIRNFVAHCESLEAEEVTDMLNEYFSEMVEVVYKHGGEVDKFIGDALLAVFYRTEGVSASGTSLRSIHCALEMRERLAEFNLRREALGKAKIEIGVGITQGEIISGPIGSKDRMDFTVIGDVVNLANRIEKVSKLGTHTKIVFSQHVEQGIRGLLEYVKLDHEPIRGKEEEVTVFELVRIRDLDSLILNTREGGAAIQVQSIELLGHCRNPGAVPRLIECLGDASESIRQAAVGALAKLGGSNDDGILGALFARLEVEPSEKVATSLIAALGRLCSDERILGLARFLEHPSERVVANTVESMGLSRIPACTDLILPKLASRNNRVKANAAMALFAAGHVAVIDTLKPMLMYSDPLMRSSAAFAIGELSGLAQKSRILEGLKSGNGRGMKVFLGELQECVPMLVALLRDPEPMVKRQAIIALGKIKDKSSVLPIIDTIDLEKDTREMLRDVSAALQAIGSHRLVREVLSQLS